MRNKIGLPVAFIATSSFVFVLGAYLLTTKTNLQPQFFITTCGEVLKNIREHVHFNPDGILSSLILLVAAFGGSLALLQIVRFVVSHLRLRKLQDSGTLNQKLRMIISKHNLPDGSVKVINGGKLAAYTLGLLKPRIIISQSLIRKLSQNQLEAVVLHEFYHFRNRHLFWLLVSRVISSLFFFIPLIEYLAQQLKIQFELAADSYVVEKQKTRDHLCGSLALNIQYANGVIPHFATSPIEKRVETLVGNNLSLERIGIRSLSISIFSILLMVGIAFIQPNQIVASFDTDTGAVCRVGTECQTTDCSGHQSRDIHNFSPLVPASYPL